MFEADGLATIDLRDYVNDPDLSDILTFSNVSIGRGLVPFNKNGSLITFNPAVLNLDDGESLETLLTFQVTDQHGASDFGEVTLTINGADDPPPGVNTAPVAGDVVISADEADGPITVILPISDADGDTLTVVSLSYSGGEIEFSVNGNEISFDPSLFGLDEGQQAVFNLTYVVDDGTGAANSSDTGNIELTLDGADDVEPPVTNTQPTASDVVLAANEADGNVTIDLNAQVADADVGDVLTILGVVPIGGFAVDYSLENGILTIDTASLGLDDGEVETFVFEYTVEDDSFQANNTNTATIELTLTGVTEGPPPGPDTEAVLDFEAYADPDDALIEIGEDQGFIFQGAATVIETDELGGSGREPNGIVNGQTTPDGSNVLVGQFTTRQEPLLDEFGNPVLDERGNPILETVVDDPFGILAPGSTFEIGDLGPGVTYGPGDTIGELPSVLPAEVGDAFSLDGLSLNPAANDGVEVTITTYRLGVIEDPNTPGLYRYVLEEADTFVFEVNASDPAEVLDFNSATFTDDLGNTNTGAFDGIYAISFSTDDGTAVVLDDILMTY